MRILDRQDEATEARTKMIENLFGKTPGDEECMAAKVNQTYNALRSVKRVGMAVILGLAVLVATKWYEGIKLNEIIAAQKVQRSARPDRYLPGSNDHFDRIGYGPELAALAFISQTEPPR